MTDRRCRMETTGGRRVGYERRSDDTQNQIDRAIWDACRAYPSAIRPVSAIAKDCIAEVKAIQERKGK